MKHPFYDPKMHSVDWDRVKAVYEPLLERPYDTEELQNIISQMIGELNASRLCAASCSGPESGLVQPHSKYVSVFMDESI